MIRQTGTAFTLMLATELEQKSRMSERLISRDHRPPRWLSGQLGPGWPPEGMPEGMPGGALDDELPMTSPPPDAPPPGVPPFLAEDLTEIANLFGAERIAILDDSGVFLDVTPDLETAGAIDTEAVYGIWRRLQESPSEHVMMERTGDAISIVTRFTAAPIPKERGLLVQFPLKSVQRIVLPQVLHLTGVTLVVLLLAAWLALRLSRSVSRPLSDLVDVASIYGEGNLEKRAAEKGPLEIAMLGRAFNRMAVSLDNHIRELEHETARREQLEGELRIAAELQRSLLPESDRIVFGQLEIVGNCEAAREVGGDFYDFWPVSDGRLALVIGDATGKGLTAALLAAKCLSIIQALASPDIDPSETFARANNLLCQQFKNDGLFVTALLLFIDTRNHTVSYSVAGHNPAILLRRDGNGPELLQSRLGLPLGIDPDVDFDTQVLRIEYDDRLLLYTDGVTETFDATMRCYGIDRLVDSLLKHAPLTLPELLIGIKNDVSGFGGGRPNDDDSTIVVVSLQPDNRRSLDAVPHAAGHMA
jgi:serine phosphatase RsbU (regulator of sigma subunit)